MAITAKIVWSVKRRIGVGDRELVRANLLQVCCINKEQEEDQLSGIIRAAQILKSSVRIYVNCNRLSKNQSDNLIFSVMGRNRNNDFMEETNITRSRFDWVLDRSDFTVEGNGTQDELADQIVEVWNNKDRCKFLEQKAWRLTVEESRSTFPDLYSDDDRLWDSWTSK